MTLTQVLLFIGGLTLVALSFYSMGLSDGVERERRKWSSNSKKLKGRY